MKKYTKEDSKRLLKLRKDVRCPCGKKKPNNDRMKYGTCRCDGYGFYYTVGHILANALYQYVADGSQCIVRDNWEIIEKHATAIREYSEADHWDESDSDLKAKRIYKQKKKNFKEAMKWIVDNWQGLWW